jgi:hypothetical protein
MNEPNLFDVHRKKKPKTSEPTPGGVVQRLIGLYVTLFEAKFREKPVITPRDGKALKRLVAHAGEDAVTRRLPRYLDLPDDYIAREGYPLSLFQSTWNKLIAEERSDTRDGHRVPDSKTTTAYLQSLKDPRRV